MQRSITHERSRFKQPIVPENKNQCLRSFGATATLEMVNVNNEEAGLKNGNPNVFKPSTADIEAQDVLMGFDAGGWVVKCSVS